MRSLTDNINVLSVTKLVLLLSIRRPQTLEWRIILIAAAKKTVLLIKLFSRYSYIFGKDFNRYLASYYHVRQFNPVDSLTDCV